MTNTPVAHPGPPEFAHGPLTRAQLAQAARQAQALAVHSRGQLAQPARPRHGVGTVPTGAVMNRRGSFVANMARPLA